MKDILIDTGFETISKQSFFKAFENAFKGIVQFFRTERNGKIQLGAAVIIVVTGFIFQITSLQWISILFCIAAVFCLEMINSAVENLCNMVCSDYHPTIKKIKDVAAGAVLIASIASVIIALIIFLPKILFYL